MKMYPAPIPDPWVVPFPGYENTPPGTILASRPVGVPLQLVPAATTQLLVRSTDSHGVPMPVVTTVMVPTTPWPGPGPRPVIAYNTAIDSLGLTCVPSWTIPRAMEIEIVPIQYLLSRNYAVVVTDHQGPKQAYAGGRLSGNAVLDALRASVHAQFLGLAPNAPIAISGYSGGAIAAGWAAERQADYAPELNVVGTAMGGAPVDYRILFASMNGANLASGVFLAAALGVAREYPQLFALLNDNGYRLGAIAKDLCLAQLAPLGVAPVTVQALSDVPNVVDLPVVQQVLDDTRMGKSAPRAPVLLYQGQQDFWIPRAGAIQLRNTWCAEGGNVAYDEKFGEHLLAVAWGFPIAFGWIEDRLAGRPMAPGCG
ncbi:lipase family protein [Aldersonia kunmingensis]|uniref:lipase family protein n=1 Tax=Aldersonia kunmingensis TaxID=408066 RepID=UPI0014710D46|nr:lipase family protein [Aldersonia kunmingensis]